MRVVRPLLPYLGKWLPGWWAGLEWQPLFDDAMSIKEGKAGFL
jgi:hypothetical protein